jgi:cobalt-zinc-cadmium efflux system protein
MTNQRRLLIVLGLTLVYVVAEVVGGMLTHSLALVADAGHLLTDALGLGLALAALRFAQRPATAAKTFGFYRIEILAALANAGLLFAAATYILYAAWLRFADPPQVNAWPMLLVAIGGVGVTWLGVHLLHGPEADSLNMKGASLEVLSDLLGAVGAVLAAIVILVTGWHVADTLVSVVIGLLILPRAWGLLREVVDVLLEAVPSRIRLDDLQAAMERVPGVVSVHDLHVWTITSGFVALSAHVRAEGRPSEDVLHDILVLLRQEFEIEHATLQVESDEHAGQDACCTMDPRCLVIGRAARARQAKAV